MTAYEYLKQETGLKDADFAQAFYPEQSRRRASVYFANTSRRKTYEESIVIIAELLADAGFADHLWTKCTCGERTPRNQKNKTCQGCGEPLPELAG